MLSNRRVLMPPAVVSVLPCIGSQTHSTGPQPVAHRLDQTAAACSAIFPAPMRWISTSRPGSLCGFSTRHRPCSQSPVIAGPIFTPMRVGDAAAVLDVRAAEVRRAHADPGQMRRQVVPALLALDVARLRLLVEQVQRLVAGVERRAARLVHAAAAHRLEEVERVRDRIDDAAGTGRATASDRTKPRSQYSG